MCSDLGVQFIRVKRFEQEIYVFFSMWQVLSLDWSCSIYKQVLIVILFGFSVFYFFRNIYYYTKAVTKCNYFYFVQCMCYGKYEFLVKMRNNR